MDRAVREGFPEEVALSKALKAGKRESHGQWAVFQAEGTALCQGSQPEDWLRVLGELKADLSSWCRLRVWGSMTPGSLERPLGKGLRSHWAVQVWQGVWISF